MRLIEHYYPVNDSLRWGHRGGRKSGECVVLFESARDAWGALDLDGIVVGGRYLEVVLINVEDYSRFK